MLIHTTYLSYIIIFPRHQNIARRSVQQKTEETTDLDCLCPLNIFCWDKWLDSLIT